ncbi:MAG: SprB repeat-containing protein, partial [Flavobacteriales bacterium]|nr:SprB repeat-containing protein [Flavobacteriales bacterium]
MLLFCCSTFSLYDVQAQCGMTATFLLGPQTGNPNPPNCLSNCPNLSCAADCNGTILANIVGGTGTYTYAWSTGGSIQAITNLCAGNYDVTV